MFIGYARVSTGEQNLDLQMDALRQAGCEIIFTGDDPMQLAPFRAGVSYKIPAPAKARGN